ncbi:MAG TPA: ABC transporter permease subunit [Streptosporangiaceae bacterium]|nr:ABC transporter permease subunit [Streptosporangiaceae bacterium]
MTSDMATSSTTGGLLGRPGAVAGASRPRLGQLVRSEWVKFWSVRGWVIGMIVAALLTVLLGVFAAGNASIGCQTSPNGPRLTGKACTPPVPLGPGGEPVTDSFYFVRQPLAGNGSITVRVTSLTGVHATGNGQAQAAQNPLAGMTKGVVPWSKAGILIATGTRVGSAYAAMLVTGSHGVRMQYNYTHDAAGLPGTVSAAAPRWLRLTRSGDLITGYDSADGKHWTVVGTARLTGLPSTVQAGMFVTSPLYTHMQPFFGGSSAQVGPSQATGVFDRVSLRGTWPAASWTGDNVGGGKYSPGTGIGGFHRVGVSFTVTGSGDIAPIVPGAAAGVPTTTFEQPLAGVFAGLIAIVVVAAMFMTAEYRRGLIRVTLAASPRRGRVLAAKAVVVGLAAFVVGLVASTFAIWLGLPREQNGGLVLLPVRLLTEARVIVGTAALVAVTAVLAVALGAILRRSAAAVTAAIVVIVLPYLLSVTVLPASVAAWVLRLTPAAGFAIEQSIPRYPQVDSIYSPVGGYYPLPAWAGFAVLCGYATVALVVALVLIRRRDA